MIDYLRTLHAHMEWADSRTLRSLVRTGGEPARGAPAATRHDEAGGGRE